MAPSCSLLTILHGESRLGACQYASNIYCLTHGLWGRLEDRVMVVVVGGRLITPIHLTASSSPDPSANTTRNNVLFKETSAAVNSHRRTAYYELQNTHSRVPTSKRNVSEESSSVVRLSASVGRQQ